MVARVLGRCFAIVALTAPTSRAWAADGSVQPATAEAPVVASAAPPATRVRFEELATAPGDRVVQRLGMSLRIDTKIMQSGQVAHQSTSEMRSQQQRTIEALEVVGGRAVKAKAEFQTARRQTPDSATPEVLTPMPTEGQSYLLKRDGETLVVTDLEGLIPPQEEFVIVAETLAGVGQANPLALVLAGREVTVGERVEAPREMAKALLGLGGAELARVERFDLTLDRIAAGVDEADGAVAVFRVTIDVKPEQADDMAVLLQGEMAIEPRSCRLTAVDLAGPVHMATREQTSLGSYHYAMDGELRVAMRSTYSAPAGR